MHAATTFLTPQPSLVCSAPGQTRPSLALTGTESCCALSAHPCALPRQTPIPDPPLSLYRREDDGHLFLGSRHPAGWPPTSAIANPCRERGKETIHDPVCRGGASLAQPGEARKPMAGDRTMERRLAAIRSAGVKSYSCPMGEDEEATIRTLTAHQAVRHVHATA
jgi:hypothetical protein